MTNFESLNPILAGTGFCLSLLCDLYIRYQVSQSYSCWYWVLSRDKKERNEVLNWVSILFLLVLGSVISDKDRKRSVRDVSILFLLVLGSVISQMIRMKKLLKSQSYSCWYWVLSIREKLSVDGAYCLNPILAGTGFCL